MKLDLETRLHFFTLGVSVGIALTVAVFVGCFFLVEVLGLDFGVTVP